MAKRRLIVALVVLVGSLAVPCASLASAPLRWATPVLVDNQAPFSDHSSHPITALACPSASFCVGAGDGILSSTDPTGAASNWQLINGPGVPILANSISCPTIQLCVANGGAGVSVSTDPGSSDPAAWHSYELNHAPADISCPTTSFCAAVDGADGLLTTSNPLDGHGWQLTRLPGAHHLEHVSCATPSLCVASDGSGVWGSGTPTRGAAAWSFATVDAPNALGQVSCASTGICVAVDDAGNVVSSAAPLGGPGAWRLDPVDRPYVLYGISCVPSLCLAEDGTRVLTSSDPTAGASSWTAHPSVGFSIQSVACASAQVCIAGDQSGNIISTTNASASAVAWHSVAVAGENLLPGLACPSAGFCAAVDSGGRVLSTTNPGGPAADWSVATIATAHTLNAIACPSTALCVAGAADGMAFASTDPGGPASGWTASKIDTHAITAINCPDLTLCVATDDNGRIGTSASPATGAWSFTDADGTQVFEDLSCPTNSLCAAVAGSEVVTSSTPAAGGPWVVTALPSQLQTISCPTTSLCVAMAYNGTAYVSSDPTGGASTWATLPGDPWGRVARVDCPTTTRCLATDQGGGIATTTDPTSSTPWTDAQSDSEVPLLALSCPTAAFCAVGDNAGRIIVGSVPPPPSNSSPPGIAGDHHAGRTLTVVHGNWSEQPTGYAEQWQRCTPDASTCSAIAGATGSHYIPTAEDVGHLLRIRESAYNGTGAGPEVLSLPTPVVLPSIPAPSSLPTVTGRGVVGAMLSATNGTWSGSPTTYTWQWQRCDAAALVCGAIPNATSTAYLVQGADAGAALRVVETATNAGGTSDPAASEPVLVAPINVVAGKPPINVTPAVIVGRIEVGRRVVASAGRWAGASALRFAYRWQQCRAICRDVPRADADALVIAPHEVGARLRVIVTAADTAGESTSISQPTSPVQPSSTSVAHFLTATARLVASPGVQRALVAHARFTFTLAAPSAGRLTVLIRGARLGGGTVAVLASGKGNVVGSAARFTLTLTATGRRLLRRGRTPQVEIHVTFRPAGSRGPFSLRRRAGP